MITVLQMIVRYEKYARYMYFPSTSVGYSFYKTNWDNIYTRTGETTK